MPDRDAGANRRHLGADAVAAVFVGDAIELQDLVPARPHCRGDRKTVDRCQIETLARTVGTSARTLSRLFSSETQLSFKTWCQRARIAAAIEKLSTDANVSVKQLASDLGYASVPAFSHAFRQVTGKTPTAFSETK